MIEVSIRELPLTKTVEFATDYTYKYSNPYAVLLNHAATFLASNERTFIGLSYGTADDDNVLYLLLTYEEF